MKAVGIVIGVLVLILIGAGVYLVTQSDALIKDAVESLGTEYLEADVSVGAVELSFTDGTGRITGFQIGNPKGYEGEYAMRVESVELALDTANLSGDLVGIKRVNVEGAKVAAVAKGLKDTNFRTLLDNLERNLGPGEQTTDSGETKVIIDLFDFTAATATLDSDVLGNKTLNIPDIHLKDIGRDSAGVTAAEAAKQILKPITEAIVRAVVRERPEVKELEGKARDQLDKLNKKLGDKLGGALKDLGHP